MISIIMPLYNAGAFLEETLQSIANQTYKNYELICVDDASDDSTQRIIQNAISKDGRIKVFRNEKREGAAYSRNRGLKHAQGDYISFLDGDDIFEEKMLEKAYKCAVENNLDIVVFEYLYFTSEKIYQEKSVSRSNQFKRRYCQTPFSMDTLGAGEYCMWNSAPWNKLFRRQFIVENKLEFQSLACSNDTYFVEMAFLLAKRIMNLNDNTALVHARTHNVSSRISFDRDPMCSYYAWKKILREISQRQLMGTYYEHCYLKCILGFLWALRRTKKEETQKMFYDFLKNEGLSMLKDNDEYYALLNDTIKRIYEKFRENKYDSGWFNNENQITYLVMEHENKFKELFNQYENVLIWGAGDYGRGLLEGLTQLGIKIYGIVDRNVSLEGRKVGNYTVWNKEYINFKDIDLVIVSPRGAFFDISQELEQYSATVIDLCSFINV